MLTRVQREISLLREYRTRLIADVVTGKLDVRAAAAALPEEGEEPEALDDGRRRMRPRRSRKAIWTRQARRPMHDAGWGLPRAELQAPLALG